MGGRWRCLTLLGLTLTLLAGRGGWRVEARSSAQAVCRDILYVDAAATGANDGSSRANAYTSLPAALNACGKQIRVA